jgi:hypothetical protein
VESLLSRNIKLWTDDISPGENTILLPGVGTGSIPELTVPNNQSENQRSVGAPVPTEG